MKNNKGFTMVELLGVMVILAILMSIAIGGVYVYREKAEQQSYDIMAESASGAVENYLMKHPSVSQIKVKDLVEMGLLERPADPQDGSKDCQGIVYVGNQASHEITNASGETLEALSDNEYTVKLCCSNYSAEYKFPSGEMTLLDSCPEEVTKEEEEEEIVGEGDLPACKINLLGMKTTGDDGDEYYKSDVTVSLAVSENTTESGLYKIGETAAYNGKTSINHSAEGKFTYKGIVKNDKGENTCEITFTKDTQGPELTVNNTSSGNWVNTDVTITATATDGTIGIKEILYSYDGTNWNDDWQDTTGDTVKKTWSEEINTKLYIKAVDINGNEIIKETSIKIDKTKPKLTAIRTNCSPPAGWNCTHFLQPIYSDNLSGLGQRDIYWWHEVGGVEQSAHGNLGGGLTGGDGLGSSNPWMGVRIKICDLANNCLDYENEKFIFDAC